MPAMFKRSFAPRTLRRATKGKAIAAVAAVAERFTNWRRLRSWGFMMSFGIVSAHLLPKRLAGQEFARIPCDNAQPTPYARGHGEPDCAPTASMHSIDMAGGLLCYCGRGRPGVFGQPGRDPRGFV